MTRKSFARLVFGLAIAQGGFSILAPQLLKTEDIFPLFTWKIYQREPVSKNRHRVLLIRRLDGQVIDPPKRVDQLRAEFPSLDIYLFGSKVQRVEFREDSDSDKFHIREVERALAPSGYRHIEWEIVEYEYDVVAFYLRGETLAQTFKGAHVSEF